MNVYQGIFIHQTDAAIAFVPDDRYDSGLNYDDDSIVWCPKSLVDYEDKDYKKGDFIEIDIPDWFAEEEEIR